MRFLRQTLLSVCLVLPCAFAMAQPTTFADIANGDEDTDIIINVLGNDLAGGSAIDPATVDLDPGGGIDPTVSVTEGTFLVDALGVVTFTPIPDYFGPVTTISYTVEDVDDQVSLPALINVTVDAVNNDPPTINPILDQTTNEDVSINNLQFTINDPDGFASVIVSGSSGDDAIIPDGNITFGGSDADRTVTIVPLPNQNGGPVPITIEVTDGSTDVSTTFDVTVTAVADPPTINPILDQTTSEDVSINNLQFTIGDPDGFAGVVVSGSSGDDAIIPDGNITFGGSDADRTVTIVPLPNQNGGPLPITIEVTDGSTDVSATFNVTVTPVADPPTINPILNQTTNEDVSINNLQFTIGDPDGFAGVIVSGSSGDDAIIPDGNITFGGSDEDRTVTIIPLPNQNGGPVPITIEVTDGSSDVSTTFDVTVMAVNDPPTIDPILDQTTVEGVAISDLQFTIGDPDGFAGIVITGASGDDTIIPDGNITFGGSDEDRTVTITPLPNQNGGPVPITIEVSDGSAEVSATFGVTVTSSDDPPTIDPILDQTTSEDVAIIALPFTIADPDGFGTTTLTGLSNNDAIIPDGNITFGGSGTNRTVTITPLPDQFGGPVAITIEVDDGTTTVSTTFNVTVTPVNNDPPSINPIGNQSVAEDAAIIALPFTIADPDGFGTVTLTGLSNNDAIIPDGNITFGGSGANRTVTITPLPNQNGGPVVITIEFNDGTTTVSANFNVTVTPSPDPPTINPIGDQSVAEDAAITALPFTIADPDGFGTTTLTGSSNNDAIIPDGNITFGGSGANRTVTITPLPNQNGGPVVITIEVGDGTTTVSTTFNVTVTPSPDPPTINPIGNQSVAEDAAITALPFTIADPDGFSSTTLTGSSNNDAIIPDGNITFGGSGANRTVTITPLPNQNGGPVVITIEVGDGTTTVSTTFNVTVTPSPDPPSINPIGNQSVAEDAAITALPFTIADPDGFGTITLNGFSNNDAIIPDANITFGGSGANRTVTIMPLPDQNGGPVVITIEVGDGTTTVSTNFNVTVTPSPDPPTINPIGNQSVAEDAAITALPFTIADPDGFGTITLTGSSNNDAIIPDANIIFGGSGANRTVTITPLANQNGGPVGITIEVSDGTTTVSTTFDVTVTPSNDAPTINPIGNQTVAEDGVITALPFTIGDVDNPVGSVTLTGSSNNDAVIPDANISFGGSGANRTVTITPLANQNGLVTITVTAFDGLASSTRNFNVSVTSVNDPPTITAIANQSTLEDTTTPPLTFTINDVDTPLGSLTVTGTSNATTVIPNTNIVISGSGADRTVTLTPAPDQSGLAVITITVFDGTTSVPMSFAVTVTPVSDPPTITTIANQLINEDSNTGALPFTLTDIDNPVGTLTLTRGSDNLTLVPLGNIVFGGSGANRTVTVTPALDQTGVATITVTVSDGTTQVPTTFQVTVDGFNDPPTISAIPNQSTSEDVPTAAIPFMVGDPETPAGDLTVTASSDNVGIIPNANIIIAGSGANRTVQITPEANQSGAAIITLTVSDGPNSTPVSFQVTVITVDDAPSITAIPNQTIAEDAQTTALPFTINDVETPIPNLIVTTSSNNLTLIPLTGIVLGGSGANQTVQVTPAANQFGVAVITVSVDDGDNTTSTNFQVTVSSVNDLPTITAIANQTINEDVATPALSFTITDIETPLASLTVAGSSDNTTLIPVANLVFGGTGGTRTVTVTPAANQAGAATVTLTLNDGTNDVPVSFLVTVNPVNDAPAITGQTTVSTNEEQAVEIEFSHLTVTDVDNTYPTGFTLTVLPNPNYSLVGNTITPNNNVAGNITVRVQVSDGALVSNIYNLQVAVNPINDPPVITGQSTLTILEDTPLNFSINNITIVDPDNTSGFTFLLAPGSNYSVSGGNIITPDAHFNGTLTVPVTVSDGTNSSAPYNLQLQVTPVNDKPQITGQTPISIAEVEPVTIDLSQLTVFDPDNDFPDDFTLIVSTGPNYSAVGNVVTPVVNFSGTLLVRVKVFDGLLESDFYDFQILVNSTNDPPVITGQRALNTEENEPIEIQFVDLMVSDPDNTYPTGFSLTILPGTTYTFTGTTVTPNPNVTGLIEVTVKVNDGSVDSAPYPLKIDINSVNDAPAITGQQPMSTLEDTPINMSLGFLIISDPDSPPAGFTMAISPGVNYTLNGVEIRPAANFNGTLSVPVTVNDGFLNSQPYNVQIQVTPVNDPPTITAQNSLSTLEDQAITLNIEDFIVTDIDNTFPTGFTLHVTQGSGPNYDVVGNTVTPKPNFAGTLGVTVVISDGVANSNSYSAEIVVGTLNDPPTLDPVNNVTILEDPAQPWATTLTGITAGVGEGTQSVAVTISTNQAEWFDLFEVAYTGGTTATLKINPKSNVNGTAQVTIRIQDDGVASPLPHINFFEYTFDFTIDPVNDPPTFTSQPITLAETAQPFEYPIVAVDEEGDPITINVTTMPAWLTLTQISNGNATLSGIPPLGTTGPVSIVIEVADPSGVSSVNQNFEVVVNTRPTITPFALSTNEDQTHIFSSEFTANYIDADGDPLFEIVIRQLPTKGVLKFTNGALVTIGAEIPASEIINLTYVPMTDSTGTDIIKWNGSDEIYYSHLDANIVISVIPFNDPPEIIALEAPESDTLKYELGSEIPVRLTKIFDARDPEGDNIIAAEIGFAVSTEYREDHDKFVFKDTLGIVGSFIESLGVLTLTGKAPVKDYVAAIRSVRYNYIDAKTPEDLANRKVSIRLNDGVFGETKDRLVGLIYTNPGLDIANAFTPNGDIENQYWRIYSPTGLERYKDALIRVYNKRGVLVYEATGFSTPWNGDGLDGALPADSYYYTIDLKYDKKKYKGVVTILR